MMSAAMTASWGRPWPRCEPTRGVRAVVVTGDGQRVLRRRGPVLDRRRAGRERWTSCATRMLPFYRTWLAVRDLEVPTIAAVNGRPIGAGPGAGAGL